MSDNELREIFHQEAAGYISRINQGLLKLELDEADPALLREMQRMAHSMKGAARAVGYGRIETISHYLEAIFGTLLQHKHPLSPVAADSIYDALDLIQQILAETAPDDDEFIAQILSNLEAAVAQVQPPDATGASTEIAALSDDELQHIPADTASDDLLQIFYTEVSDYLAALNDGLLQVETGQAPDDTLLREMNRVAHSMKGAARAVGFSLVEHISHYIEDVFQQALHKDRKLTPRTADILYDGLDLIQQAVDGQADDSRLINTVIRALQQIAADNDEARPGTTPANHPTPLADADDDIPPPDKTPEMEIPPSLVTTQIDAGQTTTMLLRQPEDSLRVSVTKLDQLMADASELLIAKMESESREARLDDLRRQHARWQREWRSVRAAYIRLVRRMQETDNAPSDELETIFQFLEANQRYLAETHRELTQLSQTMTQDNIHMATVADQLQETVSDLRMMPFETITSGFQRMVRDVARDLGKQIHFEITGAGVEVDKTVLDALKDPLMHLLRNAIDHGIEHPAERIAADKPAAGNILLQVKQLGSEIAITVHDDGRGFDTERIRRKAVERQLLSEADAANLSEDDIQRLVFHSGFSTSERVTALSGRGLGMDIVRTRIENLRGRVQVYSETGDGTMIFINVPVSLTRIRAVTLRVGHEEYAIPSVMIDRMETISRDRMFTAEGREMLTLNERPLPLISLAGILGAPVTRDHNDSNTIQILALRSADRAVAFQVTELYDEVELVLKPLGRELQHAPFVAGAALLGTGQVIIVLDANDLIRNSSSTSALSQRMPSPVPADVPRTTRVLVIDDSITTRTLEKNILENAGFDVYVAIDGAEAWQRLPEIEPDVVVSDIEMPQMNGLELTRRMKESPRWNTIPVILLTSLGKPEQREAGLKAGANAYLIKSRFNQAELLGTIEQFI